MFSCMVEIHNMHRIGEVFLNYMSNPVGSVPQDHNFSCSVQSTSVGKRIKEATKLFYIEPSCHILNGSGLIEKDAWHQFRTLTTGDAFKNRSHFDLSIDICFALGFSFFHSHASSAYAGRDSIGLNIQAPDGWAKDRASLCCLRLFVRRLLKECLHLLFFLLSQRFSYRLDQVEGLSL